jgi:hypothetical protein
VAAKGRRRKKVLHGAAALYRSHRRLEKGGVSCGRSGGGGEAVSMEKWRWLRSECGRHGRPCCSDRAADGWARVVSDFFQFIQNRLNFKNHNQCLILLQKFLIFACS